MLRYWFGRFVSQSKRRTKCLQHQIEALEARLVLSVNSLTNADPLLYGDTSNGHSGIPSISASGNITAFRSFGTNLLPGADLPGQIYAFNSANDTLNLVTQTQVGGGPSIVGGINPVVSSEGRYVVYFGNATDLVDQVTGQYFSNDQLFMRDLQSNSTSMISVAPDGVSAGNADSGGFSNTSVDGINPSLYSISGNSRYVVFWSTATNLVSPAPANPNQLYMRDLQTNTTRIVSLDSDGNPAGPATGFLEIPFKSLSVSDDGRYVSFITSISGLVPGDVNSTSDVFVRDLVENSTRLISVKAGGTTPGNGSVVDSVMTRDGTRVYFISTATDLVTGATITGQQLYVRDLTSGTTSLVSHAMGNLTLGGNNSTIDLSISNDGRFVTFSSDASNLVSGDTNSTTDVFLVDMLLQSTTLVSHQMSGVGSAIAASKTPTISGDGSTIVFGSEASNLVANFSDINGSFRDYYVFHRTDGSVQLLTSDRMNPATGGDSTETNLNVTRYAVLNADGAVIAFRNQSSNLVENDNNRSLDVFRHTASGTSAISRRGGLLSAAFAAGGSPMGASAGGSLVLIAGRDQLSVDVDGGGRSLYLRDTTDGTLTPIPSSENIGTSDNYRISPDGRYVVFASGQVRLYDRQANAIEVISLTPANSNSEAFYFNTSTDVSADGRYVVFSGRGTDLVPGFVDGNGNSSSGGNDLFLRDRLTGETILVNRKLGTTTTSGNAGVGLFLQISADGHRILFDTNASDLVSNDTNGTSSSGRDIYAFDVLTSTMMLVSANAAGVAAGVASSFTASSDGRYVAFVSRGNDIVAGISSGGAQHVYVRDLQTGLNRLLDINSSGTGIGNGFANAPQITPDGRSVVFQSTDGQLIAGVSTSGETNIYVRDLISNQTRLASAAARGNSGGNGPSTLDDGGRRQISANGRYVVFESTATNLVTGFVDGNGLERDLYLRDLQTGATELISRNRTGTASGNKGTSSQFDRRFIVLDDGRVIFGSSATDLTSVLDANQQTDTFLANPFVTAGGTIRGTVFEDTDGDGIRDAGESGIFNAVIYIDTDGNGARAPGEVSVLTNSDGTYAFLGVSIGTQRVRQDAGANTQITQPGAGSYSVAVTADGQTFAGRDFGNSILRPELAVESVIVVNPTAIRQSLDVTWTVKNSGQFATGVGGWQDAVYLSKTPTLNADSILLTTVLHIGDLNAGASYQGQATLDLTALDDPFVPYYIIVQTDRQRVVAETVEVNNSTPSVSLTVQLDELQLGIPQSGEFTTLISMRYYQITVDPGQYFRLVLDSEAVSGAAEIFVRRNVPPTRSEYDARIAVPSRVDQSLTVPDSLGGTYYVLVYSADLPVGASRNFTIGAEPLTFEITATDQSVGDRGGSLTIGIQGAKFAANMIAELFDGTGNAFLATRLFFVNGTQVYATFDLTQVPEGTYGLRVTVEEQSLNTVLPEALTVIAARPEELFYSVTSSAGARFGRDYQIHVPYKNLGTHDLAAPTFLITTDPGIPLRLAGSNAPPQSGSIEVQAVNSIGPAGILAPGGTGTIQVIGTADTSVAGIDTSVHRVVTQLSAFEHERLLKLVTGDIEDEDLTPAVEELVAPAIPPSDEQRALLEWDEAFLRALAGLEDRLGYNNAGALLNKFLGGIGADTAGPPAPSDFPSGSPLSNKVRETKDVQKSFDDVNDAVTMRVKRTLEDAAKNGVSASVLEGFEFKVTTLKFYGRDLFFLGPVPNPLGSILLPGLVSDNTLDLRLTFGAMQQGKATLRNVKLPPKGDNCVPGMDHFSVTIEYEWKDVYNFGQNDLGGGGVAAAINGFAFRLQSFGWATGFNTSFKIDENLDWMKARPADPSKCSHTNLFFSLDPNDITGFLGHEDEHWIQPDLQLPYRIRFENDPELATAPAQEVVITEQLDDALDWDSFEFGDLGFGSVIVDVPSGLQAFQTRVDYQNQDGTPLFVDVNAVLNRQSGSVTWSFRSVDPETGLLPEGVFDGFLPVDDDTGRGEGFTSYFISPKANLTTGAIISAQAAIVFDINPPLLTNVFTNTIDNGPPISSVAALPAITNSSTFPVSWSGNDDAQGAGVAFYDVYVATDGGVFEPFLLQTDETSATFTGAFGHSYAFYSVATDNVGHREITPQAAQSSTTTVLLSVPPVARDESYAFPELTPLTVEANGGVLGNDYDDNLDPLTATLISAPLHGTFNLNPDGSFTYAPNASFAGTDQFTYRVSDGVLSSNIATVQFIRAAVIEAPQLNLVVPAVTWIKKQPPVTVLPQVTVSDTDLSGGVLTIGVNAIGSKKKAFDLLSVSSSNSIGNSSGVVYANGRLSLQVQLGQNATASSVQAFLRGIKFLTKGKGLKTLTRTMNVTLAVEGAPAATISQTIQILKKA